MKIIAIEEHYMTTEIQLAWEAMNLAASDPSVAIHAGELQRRLLDLSDERLGLMDETGIDVQVLSLTTPALHDLGSESIDLALRANDAVAEAIASHPARYQGMAALPVAAPDAAARELERCVSTMGFTGTMLCGRADHHNLDHASFYPIFEAAARLGVPVLLHPRTPARAVRDTYYSGFTPDVNAALSMYALGWHYDAGMQFVRLVLSGIFDRLPDLQVILGHWGEVVLFYAERLAALDRISGLKHSFSHYLSQNLYVTASGMFSKEYLARAKNIVGADRLLFSSDYPYQYRPGGDARRFIEDSDLTHEERMKFSHSNWTRLTNKKSA
ncbi:MULTISPECIES: amidohydrolase family protein [unclassified Pantoea]|uniref:amidohydrolase family protein n=1 Tax=unclassified Pantoea TaxID=2630326 RepID=UPI00301CDBAC